MKFASRLGERSLLHAKKRSEATPWGEIWGVGTGSYNHQLFMNERLVTRRHEHELVGIEQRLFDQLGKVMAAKQLAGNPSPTVLLDLGGMFGLSLARFAAQADIHEKIQSGQLALIISNLSLQVDQALLLQNKRPDNLSRDDIALLKEQRRWYCSASYRVLLSSAFFTVISHRTTSPDSAYQYCKNVAISIS